MTVDACRKHKTVHVVAISMSASAGHSRAQYRQSEDYLRLGRRLAPLAWWKELKYSWSSSRACSEMPLLEAGLSLVVDESEVLDDDGVRGFCDAPAWSNEC